MNTTTQTADCIFVSIASYRDSELIPTVIDLLEKVSSLDKVQLGICQQLDLKADTNIDLRTQLPNLVSAVQLVNSTTVGISVYYRNAIIAGTIDTYVLQSTVLQANTLEANTLQAYMLSPNTATEEHDAKTDKSNDNKIETTIQILTIDASDAAGPQFARALIEQCLYPNVSRECTHYLLIDSHMCFTKNFDVTLFQEWRNCGMEKAILTCYPYDYVPVNTNRYTRQALEKRGPTLQTKNMPASLLGFKSFYFPKCINTRTSNNNLTRDVLEVITTPGLISKTISENQVAESVFGAVAGTQALLNSQYHGGLYNRAKSSSTTLLGTGAANAITTSKSEIYKHNTQLLATNNAQSFDRLIVGFPVQERLTMKTKSVNSNTAVPSLFWAACFSFAPTTVIKEVPYDPYAPFVFIGEEYVMAARLFTNGYMFFAPRQQILYHLSDRKYRPTFWEQLKLKSAPIPAATPHIKQVPGNNSRFYPRATVATAAPRMISSTTPTTTTTVRKYPPVSSGSTAHAQQDLHTQKERKRLEREGYIRLKQLLLADQLYVPTQKGGNTHLNNTHLNTQQFENLLELTAEDAKHSKYGFGTAKTYEHYETYCGINIFSAENLKRARLGLIE